MRIVAIFLAVNLIHGAICFGQTKMRLSDKSKEGSPVKVSGIVSFEDTPSEAMRYSYRIEASIENVSKKDIVLTVIHFGTSGVNAPALDQITQIERFFVVDDLRPSKPEAIVCGPFQFGAPIVDGHPVSEDVGPSAIPVATAQVTFVQFADGSVWGNPDDGRIPIVVRNNTTTELTRLQSVLDTAGEEALKAELLRENSQYEVDFPGIATLVKACNSKASSCIAEGLHNMIRSAKQHTARMTAGTITVGSS